MNVFFATVKSEYFWRSKNFFFLFYFILFYFVVTLFIFENVTVLLSLTPSKEVYKG